MDLQKMYEEARKNEINKVEKNKEDGERSRKDDRVIALSPGNTYRFRLLYYIPEKSTRRYPFINKYVHSFWDDGASNGNKSHWVTCPTSEYLDDKNGFKKCPICEANSKFYKDAETNKSVTSKELYNQFKRKFYGFAMIYVVNDPKEKENNGKIKVMKYTKTLNDFLKLKIFGIKRGSKGEMIILPPDDENVIGSVAFDLKNGFDLVVTVNSKEVTDDNGKKRTYPEYSYEFSRKPTAVAITDKDIADAEKELKFDSEFYSNYSSAELMDFYKKFVLKETVAADAPPASKPEEKIDDLDYGNESAKSEPAPVVEKVVEKTVEKVQSQTAEIDDIDIDAILKNAKEGLV